MAVTYNPYYSVSGLASGMDTQSLINKLMSIDQQPLIQLQNQQAQLQTEQNDYTTLNTDLTNLSNALNTLQDPTTFTSKTATVANSSVLSATADTSAINGSYNVVVSQLAQQAEAASGGSGATVSFTDSTTETVGTLLGSGFTGGQISIGGATINVSTTDTLDTLVSNINAAQSNVIATAINNQLVLTAAQGGSTNQITVGTAGPYTVSDVSGNLLQSLGVYSGTTVNTLQSGVSAQLTINGIAVSSNTNTISNAVTGLTLNLSSTGSTTVQVATDTTTATNAVQNFVTQYNAVMDFIDSKTAYNSSTNTAGDLMGDSTVTQLQQSLRNLVSTVLSGTGINTAYNSLLQVGIGTSDQNNDLTFNSSTLAAAVSADPTSISNLFGATGTNGIATQMNNLVQNYTMAGTGIIPGVQNSLTAQIQDLSNQMDDLNQQLSLEQDNLVQEFNAMESSIQSMQSQGSYLSSMLSSLPATTTSTSSSSSSSSSGL